MIPLTTFLQCVRENAARVQAYEQGHDGSDGKCDCIGLIIGAVKLAGGSWPGTHGSNWAARNAMNTLNYIDSTRVGDDYVLTQAMLDMQSSDTYGILIETTLLKTATGYVSTWNEGSKDYTATQDCYVAFWYNINGSDDISSQLENIANAISITIE